MRKPFGMRLWKFYLVTFGCKVNQYEGQAIFEAWKKLGGTECAVAAEADIICINSCAVTAKGERDARNAVFRLRREAPTARLILTGCAARLYKNFQTKPDKPDLIIPQEEKYRLLFDPWIEKNESPVASTTFPPFAIDSFKRARPVLKVQDGCSRRCTYCIVPLTRGKSVSRPFHDILEETRRLLNAGHAEIMLSGVNLSQYRHDVTTNGNFWDLLRDLDRTLSPEFGKKARLRLSSLDPSQLDDRGLEVLASSSMVCPHLHISLQHTSQSILQKMGRGHYSAESLASALRNLSTVWPAMGLGADILVGFPGETEDDVEHLLTYIDGLALSYAHVFPYSPRPGTVAATLRDQKDIQVKIARAARVRACAQQARQRFLQAQLALPRMFVAPDIPPAPPQNEQKDLQYVAGGHNILWKGVNEYYIPCCVNAPTTPTGGLLAVRPTGIAGNKLITERI
ncbi:MAG: MiaB/RimO family radical SAM methylthiotransferase [Desulfovibrio sp.]|nr:MiaB/RimO family radical SAM methylthiotransferase [Desulfovibrio sp.]